MHHGYEELHARLEVSMERWRNSPEGQVLAAELRGLSDEQLVARWEAMPRFRDVPRGGRRC